MIQTNPIGHTFNSPIQTPLSSKQSITLTPIIKINSNEYKNNKLTFYINSRKKKIIKIVFLDFFKLTTTQNSCDVWKKLCIFFIYLKLIQIFAYLRWQQKIIIIFSHLWNIVWGTQTLSDGKYMRSCCAFLINLNMDSETFWITGIIIILEWWISYIIAVCQENIIQSQADL